MCAAWGAALLIAAASRAWLAAPAGILFALGYLCSQKAAYVAAVPAVILAVRLTPGLELRAFNGRRAVVLLLIAAFGLAAAIVLFDVVVSGYYVPSGSTTIAAGFNTFAYYRQLFGMRAYR